MPKARTPMLKSITLGDFLSYGPGICELSLEPLTVVIGPNGSGKSNLVEAFSVLRAVPRDLPLPIRKGGGVRDWLYLGPEVSESAALEVVFNQGVVESSAALRMGVRYRVEFGAEGESFVVLDERISNEEPAAGRETPYFYFGYTNGRPMLNNAGGLQRQLKRADIDQSRSILSQRRDPEIYPEVAQVGDLFNSIMIYRAWRFGPSSPARASCRADVRTDVLEEDFSNLPARLMTMLAKPDTNRRLLGYLGRLAEGYSDLRVMPEGGTLHLKLIENDRVVSAHRVSDGTLRFICLMTILLDPGQTRLVVIEEPELGLHPDALLVMRDLLIEARRYVQIVVTTHSTHLIDAMTEHADAVVVAEKDGDSTWLTRLEQSSVDTLTQGGEVGLGFAWMSGAIGGTRW